MGLETIPLKLFFLGVKTNTHSIFLQWCDFFLVVPLSKQRKKTF